MQGPPDRGPLAGVRVLEVAQWWFVPAAGAVLADWGADVVKIEHPVRGDAQRGLAAAGFRMAVAGVDFMMQQSNRGKRSVGLDIGVPEGRALLLRLAAESDVFLTNFLPSARAKLGIDVEAAWRARLDRQAGPWGPLQTARELHDDPQAVANGNTTAVDGGDEGRFALVASPVRFDGRRPELAASPEMGQNTEEVLLERGLDWATLAKLKKAGAIL